MDIKQWVISVLETVIKVVIAVFIIKFVYNAAIEAYDFGYRVFAEEPVTVGEGRTISIYVKEDESVRDVGADLERKGLIRDGNLFFVQELLSEHHGKIQPGIYDLNTSMSSEEMLAIMAAEAPDTEEEDDSR
ncbi:MAG: endolytic transglycosylase MltG [Lachnospiraceae bacterium]|nr:endolytic transglycosylase MltG [Lachnospiraceae bacterium]